MLRDGKFIKEPPIKIGAHYIPPVYKSQSEEETLIQHVMLNDKQERNSVTFIELGLSVVVILAAAWMIANIFKFIVDLFLG